MELKCLSRSLPGDQPPDTPQWFVNGTELMNLNQLPGKCNQSLPQRNEVINDIPKLIALSIDWILFAG